MTEHNKLRNKKGHQDDDFDLDDYLNERMHTGTNQRPGVTMKAPKKESHKVRNLIIGGAIIASALYFTNPIDRISNVFFGEPEVAVVPGGIVVDNVEPIEVNIPPINIDFGSTQEYSDELLEGMGEWMADMGYGDLSKEELISLRRDNVTATNTSEFRDLGYTDLTLDDIRELGRADVDAGYISDLQDLGYTNLTVDQMIELEKADVSPMFASMMQALNYDLSVEDLALLRRNGVTANFTSQMHDLGYTDLTKEQLRRLRTTGVTVGMVEQMIQRNNGDAPTFDEIIRYRISNQ